MNKQAHALLIAPYYYPRNHGGAVRLYDGLVRRCRTLRMTVLSERQDAPVAALETFDRNAPAQRGYEVRRMKRMCLRFRTDGQLRNLADSAWFLVSARLSFRRCLTQVRPDIVICGGVYAAGWLFNTVPNRIARINYVLGEELTQEISGGPWSRYLRRQQLRALQTADANIALSRFTAAALAEMVGAQAPPVHLQPGSVDTDHFRVTPDRGEQRKRWGWAGRMVLLTVARLVARKGIDRVLHALSFLRTQHRLPANWLYVIAGHGPEQQRLRALSVELGLSEHVRFTGFVADDDLPGLYNAADVFILANRDLQGDTEGFGLVFLEASACGLPVIGGGEGGTGDAIESGVTGLRVDAEDVAALADSISLLMTDGPLRERFARAGLERVNQRFSITSGAARFEQLLQTIHAEHTATRGQRRSRIS